MKFVTAGNGYVDAIIHEADPEKRRILLGMSVNTTSLTHMLDAVRNRLLNENLTEADRVMFERTGKVLLGLSEDDPRPFFKALPEVYRNIRFETYAPNLEATGREVTQIQQILADLNADKPVIVDLGCGTGRIANTLAETLPGARITGMDPSPENLLKARKSDTTQQVMYIQSGWENISEHLKDESVDMIVILGRSICHARTPHEFIRIFDDASRALKPGGIILFDLPDPNKGEYLQNRIRTLHIYRSLGIPLPKDDAAYLPEVDHVIDSADNGRTLYDRYTPDLDQPYPDSRATLRMEIESTAGIGITEISRAPIEGWQDAETVYYLAQKLPDDQAADRYALFAQASSH